MPRTALILGAAACVWDDVEAALDLGEFDGAIGVKRVGLHWPGRLDGWVGLHPEFFKPWTAYRETHGLPRHAAVFSQENAEWRFPGQTSPGSSGLFGLKVALIDLGFDRAVLCGMPMTQAGAHFNDTAPWRFAGVHHNGWREALPHIKDRARSMGGWTADLLGRPDEEWIAG